MSLQRVSHYRVLRKLGEGGMGQVYLGQDLHLNRYVGIKFLPRDYVGDRERLARFHQEALIAASINHPNVLTIYGIEEDGGELFIITEFVDGVTLRQTIDHRSLPIDEVLSIAIGITAALQAAHAYWVVHRDIKPANVMVREDGVVKVLDFGIAKLNDPALLGTGGNQSITMPGCVPGSLWYVAPERLKGEAADPRSDIYSVGAILYEMLAGEPPFRGRSLPETMDQIVNREPPPLGERRRDIPEEIERLVLRAIDKDPERRYEGAAQLRLDLQLLRTRFEYEALGGGK